MNRNELLGWLFKEIAVVHIFELSFFQLACHQFDILLIICEFISIIIFCLFQNFSSKWFTFVLILLLEAKVKLTLVSINENYHLLKY